MTTLNHLWSHSKVMAELKLQRYSASTIVIEWTLNTARIAIVIKGKKEWREVYEKYNTSFTTNFFFLLLQRIRKVWLSRDGAICRNGVQNAAGSHIVSSGKPLTHSLSQQWNSVGKSSTKWYFPISNPEHVLCLLLDFTTRKWPPQT